MKIDSAQAREHDEIIEVTSNKGDKAVYKINKLTKQVYIQTALGDGNDHEWRHCNVSYEAVQRYKKKGVEEPQYVAPPIVAPVVNTTPIEPVDPFSRVKKTKASREEEI